MFLPCEYEYSQKILQKFFQDVTKALNIIANFEKTPGAPLRTPAPAGPGRYGGGG